MQTSIFTICSAFVLLFFIYFIAYQHKKIRKELEKTIVGLKHEEDRLHQKVLHAEYHFKQVEQIEREMKEELQATKNNRQFLNSAIRGKLQKTKRQPKRRKRAS